MKEPTFYPNRFFVKPSSESPTTVPDYVPRRARDSTESARRRANPRHTLVLEQQLDGLIILRDGLARATNIQTVDEWVSATAPAVIGSGRYHLDCPLNERQVRYTKLPKLARPDTKHRPGAEEQLERGSDVLETAIAQASGLLVMHLARVGGKQFQTAELATGKLLEHTAYMLGVVSLAEITADPGNYISGNDAQMMGMQTCKDLVRTTDEIGIQIGAKAALTQLVDPLSPLAIEIQTAGSDSVVDIYERAAA